MNHNEPIRAERLADAYPKAPLHNLLMPHSRRYADVRGCPPGCPRRVWFEAWQAAQSSDPGEGLTQPPKT